MLFACSTLKNVGSLELLQENKQVLDYCLQDLLMRC